MSNVLNSLVKANVEAFKGLKGDSFLEKYKLVANIADVNAVDFGVLQTSFDAARLSYFCKSLVLDDDTREMLGLDASITHLPVRVTTAPTFDAKSYDISEEKIIFNGGSFGFPFVGEVPAMISTVEVIDDVLVETGNLNPDGTEETKPKHKKGDKILQLVLGGVMPEAAPVVAAK